MKILLAGATGLIGNAVAQAAMRRGFEVMAVGFNRKPDLPPPHKSYQIDLRDPLALERLVFDHFPDVIINAAAYSSQRLMQGQDELLVHALNVGFPARLAQLAHHISARFYHFSTDMVFSGKHAPYRTTDLPHPNTEYGRLKLESEREVLKYGANEATVLRITLTNGNSPGGNRSFHERLFNRLMAGETPVFYTEEIRQPGLADNIGDLVTELCERPNLHGIFHWAGAEALNAYEMAACVLKHFGLPENLIKKAKCADEPAQRVGDLSLILQPLASKVKTQPPTFEQQLETLQVSESCRAWFEKNSSKKAPPKRFVKGVDF